MQEQRPRAARTLKAAFGIILMGVSSWGCQAPDSARSGGGVRSEPAAVEPEPGALSSDESLAPGELDLIALLEEDAPERAAVLPAFDPACVEERAAQVGLAAGGPRMRGASGALLEPVVEHLHELGEYLRVDLADEAGGARKASIEARDRRPHASLDRLRAQIGASIRQRREALAALDAASEARVVAARQARDWQRELDWTQLQLQSEDDPTARFSLRKKVVDLKKRLRTHEVEARAQAAGSESGAADLQAELSELGRLDQIATLLHRAYIEALTVVAALANSTDLQQDAEARSGARASVRIAREHARAVERELRSVLGGLYRERL